MGPAAASVGLALVRVVDQGGSARDVGLGGGSVEDLGMNASTLERIRFAAANRLCVDVGYEGDVQRVEPHSLRKARGGNVVLYVYVVKTSGTKGEPLKRATWTLTGSGSSQICQPPFG